MLHWCALKEPSGAARGHGRHENLALAGPNDVAGVKLSATARLYLSVHPHALGREERLDFGTAVDHCRKLEQLAEPDHLPANWNLAHPRNATGGLRTARPRSTVPDGVFVWTRDVAATFARGGRNFQRIHDEESERLTAELWDGG